MCTVTIRSEEQPIAAAASTYCKRRACSTWARMTRAMTGQLASPMARMTDRVLDPRTVRKSIASRIPGNACITSVRRMRKESTQRPTYPAVMPIDDSDHDGDRLASEPDEQRKPRAVQDPAPEVAAEVIRPNPVLGARPLDRFEAEEFGG